MVCGRRAFLGSAIGGLSALAVELGLPRLAHAALTVRYFSTSAAGAEDGTTWADRAALFTAGAWSTIITGFDFSGSDALECRIGPGTYTCTESLASGLFANAPTITNPLTLHGCDSSGNRLTPDNPDWTSDMPVNWDTNLPVIATTTNIATLNLANTYVFLAKLTASGRNAGVMTAGTYAKWLSVVNSTNNSAAYAVSAVLLDCSALSCSGAAYSSILSLGNGFYVDNVRLEGNAGSSGNRDGLVYTGSTGRVIHSRVTSVNNGGRGWAYTGTSTGVAVELWRGVFANNAGDNIQFPNTAAQTVFSVISQCMITGSSAYGVNPGGANTNLVVRQCRLRDNTTANFGTFGNYPTDGNNYTTDAADADDYVDASGGDYRIKSGSLIHGMGFGVSDQATAGSSRPRILGY